MANNYSLLQQNGITINNAYDFMQEENLDLYHKTNANSLPPIVKSLNQNFKKLNFIQNQYNVLNNLNQEALYKKEQLLKLKNDDLSKQLGILENIQSNIANKDRIIDQTNLSIENYDLNMKIYIIIIVLSAILLVSVLLYGNGRMDTYYLTNIFIIIMVIFVISLMCIFNIFNFRYAVKSFLGLHIIRNTAYELKYLGDKAYKDVQNEIGKIRTEWIDANCKCPDNVVVSEEEIYAVPPNIITKEIPGVFYYDGTAPQQLLLPTPLPKELNLHQQIEWPDYSPDGTMKYDAKTNKTIYINNNYYNYANNKAPYIMESTNPVTAPLTNSTTYTADL